jgi:prevent-host-death family protein
VTFLLDLTTLIDYFARRGGAHMKTMAISEFKAHALKVLDDVAKSQETIVITKRGKPIAQVGPHRKSEMKPIPGKLAHAFVFEKDIITPLGKGLWEAYQ